MDRDKSKMRLTSGRLASELSFTSGFYLHSDQALTSGLGGPNPFMIGEGIDISPAMQFCLSPRIYQVTRVDGSQIADADVASSLEDVPSHLVFQESARHERSKQSWVSDDVSCWQWELVLVQTGEAVAATLTATPPSGSVGVQTLIWRANGAWDFFGSNRVELCGHTHATLTVSAP